MAHQKINVLNPLRLSPTYHYSQHDQEPITIDHSCHLADDSSTKIIVSDPGIYGAAKDKTLELKQLNLKILVYTNPYFPQSSIHFCADIWQNGAKVLSRGKLLAAVIPMNQPNANQTFTIKDDKGELIDFKKRFAADKYNVTSFSLKTPDATADTKCLYSNETLGDELPAVSPLTTWPATLRRPKVSYSDAQQTTDDDLKKKGTLKRTFSTLFPSSIKKPALDIKLEEDHAAKLTDGITPKLP